MKKYLALPVFLALASIASFGSHPQGRYLSQFHVPHAAKHQRASTNAAGTNAMGGSDRFGAAAGSHGDHAFPSSSRPGHFTGKRSVSRKGSSVATVGFVSAPEIPAGGTPENDTFQADVNGDGKLDIVSVIYDLTTLDGYGISVTLGNGDGTFQAPVRTLLPNNDPILVGDLNGDGKADVIQVHPGSPSTFDVWIADANGDAGFTHAQQGATFSVSNVNLQGGILTDLDGDGKLDVLAVDNNDVPQVWTLLGNGDGTFQTGTSTNLPGASPGNLVFADFDGDGKVDFAVEGPNNQIIVYLQTASGFVSAGSALVTPNTVYDPCGLAAGDLTGDGKAEIVAANCHDENLTVYVNNGDGTFQTGVYYGSASAPGSTDANIYPEAVTIADVNADGKADIIVSNDDGSDITILLGKGDGTVTVPTVGYAVGGYPYHPAVVGDFNGDGLPDIIVSDAEFSYAYLQGYGDGTFRSALDYYAAGDSFGINIASGDFNGDGIPDFVMSSCCNEAVGITVFISRADGSLMPGVNYGSGGGLLSVAVADFNGDGKLDIAAGDRTANVIDVFLGAGDGTFTLSGTTFATSAETSPIAIATGDFNHDGFVDLAVADQGTTSVDIFLGDGTGNFGSPTNYPISQNTQDITVADVNGDGYLDLLVPLDSSPSNGIALFLGKTDNTGTFNTETDVAPGFNWNYSVAVGDLNGDGKPDLAFTVEDNSNSMGVAVALGNGDGTFQAATLFPTSLQDANLDRPYPAYLKIFDLNADGKSDIIVTNSEYGTVATLFGNGDGTLGTPHEYASGGYAFGLALGDVNGDGATDVVTAIDDSLGATVLLNNSGSGTQPDFKVAADTTTATVSAGSPATFNLTVTGANGYTGTVTFACSGLPASATCAFSPASVKADGTVPLATALTISTVKKHTTSSAQPGAPDSSGTKFWESLSALGIFGMLLAGSGRKRTRRQMGTAFGIALLAMTFTLTGCGDDKTVGTPAGTYTVVVTATGTGNTTPTHVTNLTLTVQ